MILQMPTGMYRDCTTGALKADGSPQDPACFDDYDAVYYHKWADKCPIQDDPLCPTHHPGPTTPTDDGCVDDPMGYVAADSSKSCGMVDAQGGWWACESLDPDFNGVKNIYVWELCPKSCKKCPTGAMSTFYLSASFSLRKCPRLLFLHAPRDPFCTCSRLSGSNLCDVCVCTCVCVYTCASGTLCLSVSSIHLRVNAAFYHPALTVESTTACSSAADCDCPTEGGWWPGWCDQGNCWYVRPSSLEFSFPLSLVRATVTRYPLFEIMR